VQFALMYVYVHRAFGQGTGKREELNRSVYAQNHEFQSMLVITPSFQSLFSSP